MGDKLSKGAATNKTLAVGGFALQPANMNHFAHGSGDDDRAVWNWPGGFQVTSTRPDDPRNAKVGN